MRMGTVVTVWLLLVVVATTCLLASCNDSSEPDYSAMMTNDASGRVPASGNGSPDGGAAQTPGGIPQLDGLPGTGEEEPVVEEELVPVVAITIEDEWTDANGKTNAMLTVEPPYYEFEKAGRYDIRISVVVEENMPPQVYRIVAVGRDGEEVGSQERHLQLPMKKPRTFDLNNFYCTSIPVAIEFYDTEKAPATTEDGQAASAGGGRGSSGGGASGSAPERGLGGYAGDEDDD